MHHTGIKYLKEHFPYLIHTTSKFVSSKDVEVSFVSTANYDVPASCSSRLELRKLCEVSSRSLYYRYLDRPREPTGFGPLKSTYILLYCRKEHICRKIKNHYKHKKLKLLKRKIGKDLASVVCMYL